MIRIPGQPQPPPTEPPNVLGMDAATENKTAAVFAGIVLVPVVLAGVLVYLWVKD